VAFLLMQILIDLSIRRDVVR